MLTTKSPDIEPVSMAAKELAAVADRKGFAQT
jgi:hypothetical protein